MIHRLISEFLRKSVGVLKKKFDLRDSKFILLRFVSCSKMRIYRFDAYKRITFHEVEEFV